MSSDPVKSDEVSDALERAAEDDKRDAPADRATAKQEPASTLKPTRLSFTASSDGLSAHERAHRTKMDDFARLLIKGISVHEYRPSPASAFGFGCCAIFGCSGRARSTKFRGKARVLYIDEHRSSLFLGRVKHTAHDFTDNQHGMRRARARRFLLASIAEVRALTSSRSGSGAAAVREQDKWLHVSSVRGGVGRGVEALEDAEVFEIGFETKQARDHVCVMLHELVIEARRHQRGTGRHAMAPAAPKTMHDWETYTVTVRGPQLGLELGSCAPPVVLCVLPESDCERAGVTAGSQLLQVGKTDVSELAHGQVTPAQLKPMQKRPLELVLKRPMVYEKDHPSSGVRVQSFPVDMGEHEVLKTFEPHWSGV